MQKNSLNTVLFVTEEENSVILTSLLSNFNCIEVSASFKSSYELIEYMNQHKTSILFIDLENLDQIRFIQKPTFIIGIGHCSISKRLKKYLDLGVFDFVLTPIKEINVTNTIGKILNIYGTYNYMNEYATPQVEENSIAYISADKSCTTKDYMFLKDNNGLFKLIFKDISFIKLYSKLSEIHFENGTIKFVKSTLKYFQNELPSEKFQKINHNVIVNLDKITGTKDKDKITIRDNVFKVTRSFKKNIKTFLQK